MAEAPRPFDFRKPYKFASCDLPEVRITGEVRIVGEVRTVGRRAEEDKDRR